MYHFKVWSLRSGQAGQLTTVALTLTGLSMHACMHVTHLQGMYIDVLLLHSIMITVTFHRLASDHSKTHFDLQTVHAPSAAFTTCSKWGDGRSLISIITNLRPVRSTIPCALIASACSCTHCTLVVANRAHTFHGMSKAVKPKLHDNKPIAELRLCLVRWQKLTACWLSKDVDCL